MRRTAVLTATVAMALMGLLASATPATAQAPPGSTASDTPVSAPLAALAPPDVSLQNIKGHLDQLQSIANSNGGTRRSTTAGYTASVSYVEQKLQAAGYTTRRVNCTPGCTSGAGPDLIADWPGGDENQVIMAGAHLDSVSAGPGINDNGSGSSMVLEVALTLAAQRPTMTKHVRFGWWSDEEQGLLGSRAYVNSLSSTDRSKIKQYLNFDMVASTNGGYFINNITTAAAADLRAFYTNLGLQPEENTEGANRSDDASFRNAGIATSGVAAGASATKTSAQATKWGGTAGRAYDSCYHRACDTTTNINDTFLDRAGDALAYAIWTQAVGTPTGRDFSINATPASGSVQAGQTATTTINTTTTSGTAQTVSLTTASGLPSGATASFNPASVTSGGSSTLTLSTSASTPSGTYTVTVTGTGETATHTATWTLTVTGTSGGRTFTNGTDFTINDLSTINSPVTSTATGTAVSPVQLSITINHTCAYDLRIRLYGPSGNFYTVKAAGGTCNSFGTRTYSVPVTEQAAGTWTLQVSDLYSVDTGTLDTWTITV